MVEIYKELEDALKNFAEDKENIEKYNPYNKINLDNLIDKFYESYEADDNDKVAKEFSWYENMVGTNNLTPKYRTCANVHYGIPTHYHGNIFDGNLYTCLFNPRSEILTDDYSTTDMTLGQYFEITDEKINEKNSKSKKSYDHELIEKKYKKKSNPYLEIKAYIKSDKSLLIKEIEDYNKKINPTTDKDPQAELSDFYYLSTYFRPILIEKGYLNVKETEEIIGWDRKKLNKIVNLELRIFRAKDKYPLYNEGQIINDNFSTYSALIVLYRLGKYLNEQKNKPIFVFRAFTEWEFAFNVAFDKINSEKCELDKNKYSDYFEFLKKNYFLGYPNQGGTLSRNNLRTYKNNPDGDRISDKDYEYLLTLL